MEFPTPFSAAIQNTLTELRDDPTAAGLFALLAERKRVRDRADVAWLLRNIKKRAPGTDVGDLLRVLKALADAGAGELRAEGKTTSFIWKVNQRLIGFYGKPGEVREMTDEDHADHVQRVSGPSSVLELRLPLATGRVATLSLPTLLSESEARTLLLYVTRHCQAATAAGRAASSVEMGLESLLSQFQQPDKPKSDRNRRKR